MTIPTIIYALVVSLDRQPNYPTNTVSEADAVLGAISSKRPSRLFRWFSMVRWAGSLVALALAPKCLLCVANYLGFATGLGLVSVELCGGTATGAGLSLRNGVPALGLLGLSFFVVLVGRRFFRNRANIPVRNDECGSLE